MRSATLLVAIVTIVIGIVGVISPASLTTVAAVVLRDARSRTLCARAEFDKVGVIGAGCAQTPV